VFNIGSPFMSNILLQFNIEAKFLEALLAHPRNPSISGKFWTILFFKHIVSISCTISTSNTFYWLISIQMLLSIVFLLPSQTQAYLERPINSYVNRIFIYFTVSWVYFNFFFLEIKIWCRWFIIIFIKLLLLLLQYYAFQSNYFTLETEKKDSKLNVYKWYKLKTTSRL